jgi:hypothetical protein
MREKALRVGKEVRAAVPSRFDAEKPGTRLELVTPSFHSGALGGGDPG